MIYEFEAEDGTLVEVEMDAANAPDIGEPLVLDGVEYRRVFSLPQVCGARDGSTRWPRFTSKQLPRYVRGSKASEEFWKGHKSGFNAQGQPRFASRHEAEEACARQNGQGDFETRYGEL